MDLLVASGKGDTHLFGIMYAFSTCLKATPSICVNAASTIHVALLQRQPTSMYTAACVVLCSEGSLSSSPAQGWSGWVWFLRCRTPANGQGSAAQVLLEVSMGSKRTASCIVDKT